MRNCIFFILYLSILTAQSQELRFSSDSINFSGTTELEVDSLDLYIANIGDADLKIDSVSLPTFYSAQPFSIFLRDSSIPADDSTLLRIYFQPFHNIKHNTELIFYTNQQDGHGVLDVQGQGVYSNTYYSTTQNLSEQALKNALNSRLASGYTSLSYNVARDNMYATLDNNAGNVTCVYTGRVASFNDRPGANNNNFNCEHTFPQGFFGQNLPMRSDIHHLFPTDISANSERGNNSFGIVTNPTWNVGGSKSGNGKFEPRDAHKGDCARAMLYFVIRYQDYTGFMAPQENVLRQWAMQYPPSTASIQRNNGIFSLQNNRNPFVDYPQLLERMTSLTSNSVANPHFNLIVSKDSADLGFAPAGDTLNYNLHFVNYGNTAISISNIAFDMGQSFFVKNGLPNIVNIAPGDRFTLPIKFANNTTFQTFNDVLNFQSNDPNILNGTVALRAETEDFLAGSSDFESVFKIWPNPVNSIMQLSHTIADYQNVTILNIQGQTMEIKSDNKHSFNVISYPSGVYFIKVEMENGSWFGKFIKD